MASLIAASTSICVVTSSAVVGSSKTIRSGSEHSAIAVMTRCSWPPDTWWGKRLPMFSGSGRLSFLNSATARFSASARVGDAVQQRRLDHLVHQPVRRVEGGGRRLRDVADLAAAQLAQALPCRPCRMSRPLRMTSPPVIRTPPRP